MKRLTESVFAVQLGPMRTGILLLLFVAFGTVSDTRRALAQATPSVSDDDARAIFTLGQNAFDQGRFRAALDYFQQAYDLSHRSALLFNIGQAADRVRDDRRALAAFEQYVREVPDATNRQVVEARIEILRETIAQQESAAAAEAEASRIAAEEAAANAGTTSAPVVAVVEEDDAGVSVPGVIAIGAGGAAAVAGAVLLGFGMRDVNDVEGAADGSTWDSVSDAYDRAHSRTLVGSILLGVGVAGVATGVVLVAVGGGGDDDEPLARVEVRALPTGLMLRGSF